MNPRRRRRKRVRSRRRAVSLAPRRRRRRARRNIYFGNPRRRRRRSHRRARSYSRRRHNPPAIRGIAGDLGWAAAGFMATKVVGNTVQPMLTGLVGDQPIMRIGVKLAVAYLSAWGLSNFMGSRVFTPAMIGGSAEALQDAIKTFIAPTFPMLSDPLEVYWEPRGGNLPATMGEYMGDGLSPDHDAMV